MYSLFYVLNNQHGDDFAPFRCNDQTASRLIRYFEDVVTENKLSALVIEGRCLDGDKDRETERLAKLTSVARHLYLFSCDRACRTRTWSPQKSPTLTDLEEREYHTIETGPFMLVMDSRFCGLLASYALDDGDSHGRASYELIWTFDPNVVFTAVEYLMSRITVQKPWERPRFEALLNACTPHTSSVRISLTFMTKLALLMQKQNELETAINTISAAISSTLELETILQSAVEEVGRALRAQRAALVLWQDHSETPEKFNVYERDDSCHPAAPSDCQAPNLPQAGQASGNGKLNASAPVSSPERISASDLSPAEAALHNDSDALTLRAEAVDVGAGAPSASSLSVPQPKTAWHPEDGQPFPHQADNSNVTPGQLSVRIVYANEPIGKLVVEDDTPGRSWESEEMLMVKTVSDQLAVAISHSRLFSQVKTQAMTDSLTALFNHGYFKERLDREIKLAERNGDRVSLILLDLDHLKRINDTFGHRAGDDSLVHVAQIMRATVREVDICSRYGGEEFVVILPQCSREDALNVAERLREAIASSPLPRINQVTASIGVATFPSPAKTAEELIEMADRAMYLAKAAGRNRVRTLSHRMSDEIPKTF